MAPSSGQGKISVRCGQARPRARYFGGLVPGAWEECTDDDIGGFAGDFLVVFRCVCVH